LLLLPAPGKTSKYAKAGNPSQLPLSLMPAASDSLRKDWPTRWLFSIASSFFHLRQGLSDRYVA
jgi:hypothetical protein